MAWGNNLTGLSKLEQRRKKKAPNTTPVTDYMKPAQTRQPQTIQPSMHAGTIGREYGQNRYGLSGDLLNYNKQSGNLTLGGSDVMPATLQDGRAMINSNQVSALQKAYDDYAKNTGLVAPKYNPQTDLVYQTYQQHYNAAGQAAASDTLAQASAGTGGRPNSYARTVAQQENQRYRSQAPNMIPELAGMQQQQFDNNRARIDEQRQQQALMDYQRERDTRGDFESDRGFAETQRQFDAGQELREYETYLNGQVAQGNLSLNQARVALDRAKFAAGEEQRGFDNLIKAEQLRGMQLGNEQLASELAGGGTAGTEGYQPSYEDYLQRGREMLDEAHTIEGRVDGEDSVTWHNRYTHEQLAEWVAGLPVSDEWAAMLAADLGIPETVLNAQEGDEFTRTQMQPLHDSVLKSRYGYTPLK